MGLTSAFIFFKKFKLFYILLIYSLHKALYSLVGVMDLVDNIYARWQSFPKAVKRYHCFGRNYIVADFTVSVYGYNI